MEALGVGYFFYKLGKCCESHRPPRNPPFCDLLGRAIVGHGLYVCVHVLQRLACLLSCIGEQQTLQGQNNDSKLKHHAKLVSLLG